MERNWFYSDATFFFGWNLVVPPLYSKTRVKIEIVTSQRLFVTHK